MDGDGAFMEWQGTGDDPGFGIALPFVRKRFLLIEVEGRDCMLDPQLYVSYGAGFREHDAFAPEPAARHLFVVDVGTVGIVRALRFDPATFPARFGWRVKPVSNRHEVERIIGERAAECKELKVHRLEGLNALTRIGRNLLPKWRGERLADHVAGLYALAERETADVQNAADAL
ncbi:MAG TPA: hypothetical protein VFJ18_00455, partial [Pararhizobium sp.]|nr:hypothetical protein [Pararhizobium sp.]